MTNITENIHANYVWGGSNMVLNGIKQISKCDFSFDRLFQLFPVQFTTMLELIKTTELNDGHRYIPELWTGVILLPITKRI